MSVSEYQIRRIRETVLGTTPAGSMALLKGSGLGSFQEQFADGDPSDVRADLQRSETANVSFSSSASSTHQFRHDPGGAAGAQAQIFEEVFGAARIAGYDSGTVTTISSVAATNTLTNSGGWGALQAGMEIFLEGIPLTGGAVPGGFRCHVVSVAGNDVVVGDVALGDQAAGSNVRAWNSSTQRLGTTLATTGATYEVHNVKTQKTEIYRGVVATGLTLAAPYAGSAQVTYNYLGTRPGVTAAALGNATAAFGDEPFEISPAEHFFGFLEPQRAFGFFVDGVEQSEIEWQNLNLGVSLPKSTRGGIGKGFLYGVRSDGVYSVTFQMDFVRASGSSDSQQDDLIAAVRAGSMVSVAFGYIDRDGKKKFVRIPKLKLLSSTMPGSQQSGEDMVTMSGEARADDVHTMIQITSWDE